MSGHRSGKRSTQSFSCIVRTPLGRLTTCTPASAADVEQVRRPQVARVHRRVQPQQRRPGPRRPRRPPGARPRRTTATSTSQRWSPRAIRAGGRSGGPARPAVRRRARGPPARTPRPARPASAVAAISPTLLSMPASRPVERVDDEQAALMPHRPGRGSGVEHAGQARAARSPRSASSSGARAACSQWSTNRGSSYCTRRRAWRRTSSSYSSRLRTVGDRDDELVGLHVEEPHLQVAPARPHRREQRRQVVRARRRRRRSWVRPRRRTRSARPARRRRASRRRRRPRRSRRTPRPGRPRAAAGRRTPSGPGRPRARWPAATPGRCCGRRLRPGTARRAAAAATARGRRAPGHQSRHTCVDAVRRIIRRPAGPIRSKWRCIPT